MALEAFSRNLWLPAAGIAMSLALGACLAIMPLASANAMEITPRDRIEDQLMFPKGFLAVPDTGRIALPAIQFEYDSDRLTETAVRQLMELAWRWDRVPFRPFRFPFKAIPIAQEVMRTTESCLCAGRARSSVISCASSACLRID